MKEAAIGIILSDKREMVLLVKRRDIPVFVLPGGGIDEGESPALAVVREVKEETGLDVLVKRKAALYSATNSLASNIHLFECEILGGELSTSDESEEVRFFPLDKMPKNLFILHQKILKRALENPHAMIEAPLADVTWARGVLFLLQHPLWSIKYLYLRAIKEFLTLKQRYLK